MSETEKKTEEKKKISSKVNTPAQTGGAERKTAPAKRAAPSEVSSKVNVPAQAGTPAQESAADAGATAIPSSPSKKIPPAAAKAAAPKPAAAKAAAPKASGSLRIRQVKSGLCAPVDQKQTLLGLGLLRIRHEVVRPDTPTVRGQVHKVRHLVEIVEGGAAR
jgi:large subunit ribosomal protein L30